jgi:GNAT superfamily N-acetyltransferase
MEIRKYNESIDYENLITLFKSEADWSWFLENKNLFRHKESLDKSITYVAYEGIRLIGYLRCIEDIGSYIYVCELLVSRIFRGNGIGKKLLDTIIIDHPEHEILIMSDEDKYYKKLGYTNVGSIFKASIP